MNDWDSAIAYTSQLEQSDLPVKTLAELATFRRQMQLFRQNQTVVSPIDGCEPVLAGFGLPGYSGRPLDFDRGVYSSVGRGAPVVAADQTLRQYEALWQSGLGVTADTPLDPLAEAQRVNTRSGSGVTTGAVSRRVDIYAFLGAQGDSANLDLTVIQQRRGLLYTDDAAQLFLFDAAGRLLSAGRTTAGQQPYLATTPLPATGVYYAAVTTPQHQPVLDEGGFITGWQGIGTSAITYTITIDGLTPSPELGLR
ncbi:pre-peptidase C-terminal domain-containing protein [Nodosilinea sp. FACHB-13]|uniref:pre-peptidase C-terminal domain-containing protein n=1 Tax=Cyanophyceae TaxID=3028117 RepID=UPI001686AD1E|nr:pre-peptidase C-terminal domain-containing protein [Nodosilinea sp. FACHB-13]MBD2109412.1 pre-peptidase C-terminal domain-containing protein [Nodosilinea sp. FACHB-13]